MSTGQPSPHDPKQDSVESDCSDESQRELPQEQLLDSLLEQTRNTMSDEGGHQLLTDYVREQRLPSKFDFDNLTELVRCIINQTNIDKLVDKEDAINWIATCFSNDPVAYERVETLWSSIVTRIQNYD